LIDWVRKPASDDRLALESAKGSEAMLLIPEHLAAGFVMVLFPAYPHQLGPSAKEPMLEFHFRTHRRRSPMGERHAEPIADISMSSPRNGAAPFS
jgi:hypothetical protein